MIRIKISGMTCEHCVRAVSDALSAVPGVETVGDVSLEKGEANVEGGPRPEALIAAVREEGYEAEIAS